MNNYSTDSERTYKILKYVLPLEEHHTIEMYSRNEILSAQMQRGLMCMWVLSDITSVIGKFTFSVYGTGNSIQGYPGKYIDTVQDGIHVWHIFLE